MLNMRVAVERFRQAQEAKKNHPPKAKEIKFEEPVIETKPLDPTPTPAPAPVAVDTRREKSC